MITQAQKDIIIEALNMKIASVKRARNATGSPRFKAVYDEEDKEVNLVKVWVQNLKLTDK